MVVNQREVYLLPHPFGNNHGEPHPHIVLSVLEANQHENTFVAVMITSSKNTFDDFSFPLSDTMFDKPLEKPDCHARMHLLPLSYTENIIGKRINTMKPQSFKRLMNDIGKVVFDFDVNPFEK